MPARSTPPPIVTTLGDRRTLEFTPGTVQSEMRLSAPTALVLAYCRAMMGFALFVPRPRHIVMVGLGGGSLAKFCHRHFPDTRISVIELRADVIALREQFALPPDDARFQVIEADAAAWLASAQTTADVLILDAYDAAGLPPALASARFFSDCRRILSDGGVLVTNILSYDPACAPMLARLGLLFNNRVSWLEGVAGNNRIVFAVKAPAHLQTNTQPPRALRVLQLMQGRLGFGASFVNRWFSSAIVHWLESRHY